jgi:hypothetical protein
MSDNASKRYSTEGYRKMGKAKPKKKSKAK